MATILVAPPRSVDGRAAGDIGPSFVIRNARVFDGEHLLPPEDVSVEHGKIQVVGRDLRVPSDMTEIDAKDETLLPGLIDSHTHDWGDSARQALLFGVTTELNMGAPAEFVAKLKGAETSAEASSSASVLSAGNVVTPPGGHGTEYGVPVPTLNRASEAQAFVDARLAEGSDYIKIILEDGRTCHLAFAAISQDELSATVAAAHKRGKMAIVHIASEDAAENAVRAGADGIAHLFADAAPRSGFLTLMRRRHAFAITTLGAIQAALGKPGGPSLIEDRRLYPFLSPAAQAQMRAPVPFRCSGNMSHAFAAAKELHAAGVPILAGTDAPAPGSWNGVSLHGEIALLTEAGFSASDALSAATSVPARLFRLSDRGRIAPGLSADLLLVRGDPTRDITATRDIVAVWKGGVAVERAAPLLR